MTIRLQIGSWMASFVCAVGLLGSLVSPLRGVEAAELFKLYYGLQNKSFLGNMPSPNAPSFYQTFGWLATTSYTNEQIKAYIAYDLARMAVGVGGSYIDPGKIAGSLPSDYNEWALVYASAADSLDPNNTESNFLFAQQLLSKSKWRVSFAWPIADSTRGYNEVQYGHYDNNSDTVGWGPVEVSGGEWTEWDYVYQSFHGGITGMQWSTAPMVYGHPIYLDYSAYRSRAVWQVRVMVNLDAGLLPLDTGAHQFFIAAHSASGVIPDYSSALVDTSGRLAPMPSSSIMILNESALPITVPWKNHPSSDSEPGYSGSWASVVAGYTVLLNEVGDGPIPPLPEGEPLTCPPKIGLMTRLQSYVLNLPAIHVHTAVDFQMNGSENGCPSCGAIGMADKGWLRLERIHRYADQFKQGAFGPGVFSNYDIRLSLWGDGAGGEIWDPQHERPYRLESPVNGVMTEAGQQLQSVTLLDGQGQASSSIAQAATAIARHHDGRQWIFEIIHAGTTGNDDLQGRLTTVCDRTGFGITITYAFPADSSTASLGSAARLWEIQGIQDRFGNTMQFTYGWSCGQPVVATAMCPNGAVISYAYDGDIAGLSGVQFPDGTSSQFGVRTDPDSRCVVIDFDDAGASGTHRRKSVGFTTLECADACVNTAWNATNRVLWVRDAVGELTYKRTTMPDGSLLVFEGGGSDGTGALKRLKLDSSGVLVKTEVAENWSMTGGLEAAGWSTVGEYETDSMLRLILTKEASGGSSSYVRSGQSGGIAQVTRRDQSGNVVASNSTERDDLDNPLRHVDENGIVTRYGYDERGLLLNRTEGIILGADGVTEDASGAAVWQWTYRPDGQVATALDPLGNTTEFVYDEHGRLINEISPPDDPLLPAIRAVKAFAYDAVGRLGTTTDASGHGAVYSYDSRNRVTAIRYADGSQETMVYGGGADANLLISKTDRNGALTTFSYDAAGRETVRVIGAQAPASAIVTTTTYLAGTELPATVIRAGQKTEYVYDSRKRVIEVHRWVDGTRHLTEQTIYDNADRIDHTVDAYGRRTYFGYDVLNRVVRQVRELVVGGLPATPVVASLTRLGAGNPAYTITDTEYDVGGQVIARIDADGVRTTFSYDALGRVTTTIEAVATDVAATTTTVYDAAGNRTRVTGPRGVHTDMTYTGRNLLATVTEAADTTESTLVRSLTYTPTGKPATEADALGRVTSYTYGTCCDRLEVVTDPAGFQTNIRYDFVGNRTTVTDANGLTATTTYDAVNRPLTQTNAAGEVTAMAYDDNLTDGSGLDAIPVVQTALVGLNLGAGAEGSAIRVTNPTGEAAYEIRDGLSRPVVRIDPVGHQTRMTYDAVVEGLVETAQTDALGHVTRVRTDGAGRSRLQIDALGNSSQSVFSDGGDQIGHLDASNVGWSAAYDARHRLLSRTSTRIDATETTSWTYDLDGNRLTETDALNKAEVYQYDLRNRRTVLTDRLQGVTRFAYDAIGNLTVISDAENEVRGGLTNLSGATQYAYDLRNLLTAEVFPTGQTGRTVRTYTYDGGRRLTARQVGILSGAFSMTPAFAGSPEATSYAYDAANRLTTRGYADAKNDTFGYDLASRLTSAASARYSTTVGRAYDAAGRLTSESLTLPDGSLADTTVTAATYTVGYGYDDANRSTDITYPTGTQVVRTYTDRNELYTVSMSGSTVATRAYDSSGRLTMTTMGNGVTETRTYVSSSYLVESIAAAPPVGEAATGFSYAYDAAGRKLTENNSAASDQTFGYDNAGRLNDWKRGPIATPTATQTWNLSLVGDWTSTTRDGETETRQNTWVHEAVQVGTNLLAYDAKGNLTKDEHQTLLAWDPENRLASAWIPVDASTTGFGAVAVYRYDALGRRVAKTVQGRTTLYLNAGAQTVVEIERSAIPPQAQIDGAESDGTVANAALTPASGGILLGTVTRINFQPATTVIPAGFYADKGNVYPTAGQTRTNGLTYGWTTDATGQTVARHGAVPLVEFDSFAQAQEPSDNTWSIALPDGTYPVVVVAGDALSRDQTNNLVIGGQAVIDDTPATTDSAYDQGAFDGYAVQVTVTNGLLTISPGAGALRAKLCFVEIGAIGTTIDQATRDKLAALITKANGWTANTPDPVTATREYAYGSYVDEVLAYTQSVNGGAATRYYVSSNHLYSPSAVTDANGVVVERYKYDAYGTRTVTTPGGTVLPKSTIGFNRGWQGVQQDEETGLQYRRQRMYSPALGRYVSRWIDMKKDPNPYEFQWNNPANMLDPMGDPDPTLGVSLGITISTDNGRGTVSIGGGMMFGMGGDNRGMVDVGASWRNVGLGTIPGGNVLGNASYYSYATQLNGRSDGASLPIRFHDREAVSVFGNDSSNSFYYGFGGLYNNRFGFTPMYMLGRRVRDTECSWHNDGPFHPLLPFTGLTDDYYTGGATLDLLLSDHSSVALGVDVFTDWNHPSYNQSEGYMSYSNGGAFVTGGLGLGATPQNAIHNGLNAIGGLFGAHVADYFPYGNQRGVFGEVGYRLGGAWGNQP